MQYKLKQKDQKTYLDGLKRYQERGIRIIIDGEEVPREEWNRIFEVGEQGEFYMGDYIGAEDGRLTEIRFDKVYNI